MLAPVGALSCQQGSDIRARTVSKGQAQFNDVGKITKISCQYGLIDIFSL